MPAGNVYLMALILLLTSSMLVSLKSLSFHEDQIGLHESLDKQYWKFSYF